MSPYTLYSVLAIYIVYFCYSLFIIINDLLTKKLTILLFILVQTYVLMKYWVLIMMSILNIALVDRFVNIFVQIDRVVFSPPPPKTTYVRT